MSLACTQPIEPTSLMNSSPSPAHRFTWILTWLYLAVLAWIILWKMGVEFSYRDTRSISLIPFPELFVSGGSLDLCQVILNMLIFLPFGMYMQLLFPKNHWSKNLLYCFLLSLFLETYQFIFRIGALDTTDLITNSAGGFLGLGIVKALQHWTNQSPRVHKIINLLMAIGTFFILVLLVLLKLDMLPIRYR